MEHWGSQTFGNNRELSLRKICDYYQKEEYINILNKHRRKLALLIKEHIQAAEQGLAYRMDYSRIMFAKNGV